LPTDAFLAKLIKWYTISFAFPVQPISHLSTLLPLYLLFDESDGGHESLEFIESEISGIFYAREGKL